MQIPQKDLNRQQQKLRVVFLAFNKYHYTSVLESTMIFTFAYSPHDYAKHHTNTLLRASKGDSASSFRISLVSKLFPGLGHRELSSFIVRGITCVLEI